MKGSPSVVPNDKTIVGKAMISNREKGMERLEKSYRWKKGREKASYWNKQGKMVFHFLSQCLLGGKRMVALKEEWKGQLKLTKLLDHCENKGSLSPSSAGQNNSTISGLRSATLLTLVSSRYSPINLERYLLRSMGVNRQASIFRCWLVGDDRHDPRLPFRRVTSKRWNVESPLIYQLVFCNA